MKEILEDESKWKDIPCSYIRRIHIIQAFQMIYRFRVTTIKIPMTFFKYRKKSKIYWELQNNLNTNVVISKGKMIERVMSWFQDVIKTTQHCHKTDID